jgi:hypothetical protein
MSDFDDVLERLLTDPSFQGALATNPDAALAGYTLDAEERKLLGAQLVSGSGEDRTVEMRTTKSGVMGLLGPVVSAFGVAAGTQSIGSAPTSSGVFGDAPGGGGTSTFGNTSAPTETFGTGGGQETMGSASTDSMGHAPVEATNYATRVDVDGDGHWDAHEVYERGDGGVDITADVNHDGVVDFVGHDYNRDGLVDVAEFDNNLDGTLETRMRDVNGDGWMDRSEHIPSEARTPPPAQDSQSFGNAPV